MATQVIATLGKVQNTPAEQLAFGPLGWTYTDEETNAALSIVVAGVQGCQHFLDGLTLSFAAAPAAACTLTVTDGSTVIDTIQIAVTAPTVLPISYGRPLRATQGAALKLDLTSPGNVKATLVARGFSSPDQTTYA